MRRAVEIVKGAVIPLVVVLLAIAGCGDDGSAVSADAGPGPDATHATPTDEGETPTGSDRGTACLVGSWSVHRTDSVAVPGDDAGDLELEGGGTVTFGDGTWTLVAAGEVDLDGAEVDAVLEVDGTAEGTFVAGEGPDQVLMTLTTTGGTAAGGIGGATFDLDLSRAVADFVPEGEVDVRCTAEELVLDGRRGATVTLVPA